MKDRHPLTVFLLLLSPWCLSQGGWTQEESSAVASNSSGGHSSYAAVFVENVGQWPNFVRFALLHPTQRVWVLEDGWLVQTFAGIDEQGLPGESFASASSSSGPEAPGQVSTSCVRLRFAGASLEASVEASTVAPQGENPDAARFHFFQGGAGARVSGARSFQQLRWPLVFPGIDVVLKVGEKGSEFELFVRPGADLDRWVLECDGEAPLKIDSEGTLRIAMPGGALTYSRPRAFESGVGAEEREIPCEFELRGSRRFGLRAPQADPGLGLRIDPGLEWSTFLGGSETDRAYGAAVHRSSGDVFVVGRTLSTNFPATPGAFDESYNGTATSPEPLGDAYVARFSSAGQLLWATFLGGMENEHANVVAVDVDGHAFVAGWTGSPDYPVTAGAYDETFNGLGSGVNHGGDLFVTKLTPAGDDLLYSTFIGGSDLEYVLSLELTAAGEATVSGHVHSSDFPITPGAYQTTFKPFSEGYLTRLNAAGTDLVFSTFFGGNQEEYGHGMAIAPNGDTIVAGPTDSPDFPTTPGAYDETFNDGTAHDAESFVTRFSADGSALVFSTYLGSPGNEAIYELALDADESVVVTGHTDSSLFPVTSGTFDTTHNGSYDIFVSRLSAAGDQLVASTFAGGASDDTALGIALDSAGQPAVGGRTASSGFPTTLGAYDKSHAGGADVFVLRLNKALARLVYSTFVGHSSYDTAQDLALDGFNGVSISGETFSSQYPTTSGAHDTTYNGNGDAFVSRLDLLAQGVTRYGMWSPPCSEPIAIGARSMPSVSANDFALTCIGAPASAGGLLGIGFSAFDPPLSIAGIDLWVDILTFPRFLFAVSSNADGYTELALRFSDSLQGLTFYTQWFWLDSCSAGGLSASNAAEIVIQA